MESLDSEFAEAGGYGQWRQMTDVEREEKCACGHVRAVHAGHDALGRCVMSRCRGVGLCGQFRSAA